MKSIDLTLGALALAAMACNLTFTPAATATPTFAAVTPTGDEAGQVTAVVVEFGARLQNVSLLAPDAAEQIEDQYAEFVHPDLLAEWMADPEQAPWRTTSSPWPDRIEVVGIEADGEGRYVVQAEVIEATSDNPEVDRYTIQLSLELIEGQWLIVEYLFIED